MDGSISTLHGTQKSLGNSKHKQKAALGTTKHCIIQRMLSKAHDVINATHIHAQYVLVYAYILASLFN